MSKSFLERSIQSCYSTWSKNYYRDYYGSRASYPPVHRDLIKRLLLQARVKNVLDAGCGPASFLRELRGSGIARYGFDLTPEMVEEARSVLARQRDSIGCVWQGSVLNPRDFSPPNKRKRLFDSAVCIGVLPHIPEELDVKVLRNLRNCVKKRGLVIVEARNQLFSLFTLNSYSYRFFAEELIRSAQMMQRTPRQAKNIQRILKTLQSHFCMDQPPVRKGTAQKPGYDEVLSRAHNPIRLQDQFRRAGFRDVALRFYHFHSFPPYLAPELPELFLKESLALEGGDDWRGYFMASAFLLIGRRS